MEFRKHCNSSLEAVTFPPGIRYYFSKQTLICTHNRKNGLLVSKNSEFSNVETQCMKIGEIICQNTPEIIRNAFRLSNMILERMEDVTIFFNGPAVDYEKSDSEQFPLKHLAKTFTLPEGILLVWGKLMDLHGVKEYYSTFRVDLSYWKYGFILR